MENLEDKIKKSLACLEQLRNEHDAVQHEKQDEIDRFLTPEVVAVIEAMQVHNVAVESQYSETEQEIAARIVQVEAEIIADIRKHGQSVRGTSVQVVWRKGSLTWDSKGLQEYAKAAPEILEFRKQGDPSVFFRGLTNKTRA